MVLGLFGKKAKTYAREGKRYSSPSISLSIDGDSFNTLDWSVQGCRLGNYRGKLKKNAKLKISELKVGHHAPVRVMIYAVVTRRSLETKQLCLRFEQLCESSSNYLLGLQRGMFAEKQGNGGGFGARRAFGRAT